MKKLRALFVSILVIALVSGCSSGNGGKKENQGKVLTVAKDVELVSMDQHVATDGLSFEIIATTMQGLYTIDAKGTAIPQLATDTKVSEDGKTYTMTMRNDAKWSNGDPVTAHDFVFSWRRLVDPGTTEKPGIASEYNFFAGVAGLANADAIVNGEKPATDLGVKALDDYTLELTLDRPVPYLLGLLAFPALFPLNEKFVTEQGDQYALSPKNCISNGPWMLSEWNQGNDVVVVRNPTYYDNDKIKLDEIDFKVVKDVQTGVLSFEQGTIDIITLSGEMVDANKNRPEFATKLEGYIWYIATNSGHINSKNVALKNVNLRKALALAYDKEKMATNVLKDGSVPANFIIPKGLSTGPDGKDFRETTIEYNKVDKAQALALWNTALTELNVKEVTLELLFEDTESSKAVSEFMKAELEATLPGLTINLKSQPKKNRLELMRNGEYDLGLTRWGPDYADPTTYLEQFIGGTHMEASRVNYGSIIPGFDDAVYDAGRGKLAGDPEGRWESMKKAEALLLDNAAILPMFQTGGAVMIKSAVTGIEHHTVGTPYLYYNADKQ